IADLQLLFQPRNEPHLGINKVLFVISVWETKTCEERLSKVEKPESWEQSMFLFNNYYASLLFDSGADRSFVSSTFSALLDVAPSTLDTSYAVELADGIIS
ncbi:hypothetical protein Tco_0406058, partial [Tanacetum coccineum]